MADVAPEVKAEISIVRNRRTDAMFMCAYLAVMALVYVVVYEEKVGEFAQGVVTLVLGMFLNELKNAYSFEYGTTRSSAAKDATIQGMAETVGKTAVTPAPANPETGNIPAAEVQPEKKP